MARVLVVDDAKIIRHIMCTLLRDHGHEVVGEATDGNEAVEMYVSLRPDIVTLDITMPEKDGLTALREIMSADPAANVIMCSALKERTKVVQALQLGAKDFILKPPKAERVLASIDKAMGLRGN